MTTTIAETTLWQKNLASLIRSGLFDRAEVVESRGLHAVVGVYGDGSHSAPLAKYSDRRRAEDGTDGDDVILVGPDVTVNAGAGHDTVCVQGSEDADHVDIRDAEDLDVRLGGGYDTFNLYRGGAGVGEIDGGADSATVMLVPDRSVAVDLAERTMSMDADSSYRLTGFDTVLASAERVRLVGRGPGLCWDEVPGAWGGPICQRPRSGGRLWWAVGRGTRDRRPR